jgi:hypothetical protein
VLSFVEYLPDAVIAQIEAATPHYRCSPDSNGKAGIWRNHCEHCGESADENDLHGDLDGPFGPIGAEIIGAIRLRHVHSPFEARAEGESFEVKPWTDDCKPVGPLGPTAPTEPPEGKKVSLGLTRLGGPLMVRFGGVHDGGQIGPVHTGI